MKETSNERRKSGWNKSIGRKMEGIISIALLITAMLIIFNQVQISSIAKNIGAPTGQAIISSGSFSQNAGKVNLAGVDVFQVRSTAMAVAAVFPELKTIKSEQDIISLMVPQGTPEYSTALGGVTFDDPVTSMEYLAKLWPILNKEVKQTDQATWQRFLKLAAAPRGISCEFCCGVGSQGVDEMGNSKCGCQHNPALLAVTLGLMKKTQYSDAQILREVMRWKTMFFPQNMVTLATQVAGKDPSELKGLPGMVGGC